MSTTVNLKLWKYRPKNDGSFPIYIRITKNRKSSWLSTDISLKLKDWDERKGKVKPSHPNSARLNNHLRHLEISYQDKVLEIENENLQTATKTIKKKLVGNDTTNFMVVARELISSYKREGKISSHDRANSVVNKLVEYMRSDKFTFQDLDHHLLVKYQNHLIEVIENKASSANKDLKFIKTVFRYAFRMEYISPAINPFINLRFLKDRTERGFLTPEEIIKFESADCTNSNFLQKAKDIALFQYYSGGIRISDALLLKWENIINGRIHLTIKKTGKQTSHKLTPKAELILNRYKNLNTEFIFNYFDDQFDLSDLVLVDSEVSAKTALVNKALKRISRKAEIKKRITTHLFRHSFATNALQQGMSLEVLQSILKHSNVRETQIYAKVLNKTVDVEIDKLVL